MKAYSLVLLCITSACLAMQETSKDFYTTLQEYQRIILPYKSDRVCIEYKAPSLFSTQAPGYSITHLDTQSTTYTIPIHHAKNYTFNIYAFSENKNYFLCAVDSKQSNAIEKWVIYDLVNRKATAIATLGDLLFGFEFTTVGHCAMSNNGKHLACINGSFLYHNKISDRYSETNGSWGHYFGSGGTPTRVTAVFDNAKACDFNTESTQLGIIKADGSFFTMPIK